MCLRVYVLLVRLCLVPSPVLLGVCVCMYRLDCGFCDFDQFFSSHSRKSSRPITRTKCPSLERSTDIRLPAHKHHALTP